MTVAVDLGRKPTKQTKTYDLELSYLFLFSYRVKAL